MNSNLKVFSGGVTHGLVRDICAYLSREQGRVELTRFADGEFRPKFLENVRDTDVFIVSSTQMPHENLFEMLLMADAAVRSSAARITMVPTYLAYNRQDRKDEPRVPLSAEVIASMFNSSGAHRMLLFDLHNETTAGYFRKAMGVDHLYLSPVTLPYVKSIITGNTRLASTDGGGVERMRAYARLLGIGEQDVLVFDKGRLKAGSVDPRRVFILGDPSGKDLLFVDDMIDGSSTAVACSQAAELRGARSSKIVASHALFSGTALRKLEDSPISEVITTDSVYHRPEELLVDQSKLKLTVLPIAQFVAKAIRYVHEGESLSGLIENPLGDRT